MTRNKKGRFAKRHTFIILGAVFVWMVVLATIVRFYKAWYDTIELVDPRASLILKKEFVVSCNNPIGFLKCKAYNGELSFDEAATLIAIVKAESICTTKTNKRCIPDNGVSGIGVDPEARNPKSTARGVGQIIAGTWYAYNCTGDKFNFKDNLECVVKIYKKSGYTPWEVFNTGSYARFLKDAYSHLEKVDTRLVVAN